MRTRSIVAKTGTVACLLAMLGLLAATPAEAAAYRYWTYWQGGPSGWTFATAGPGATVPADGSVEGWRFAVTTAAGRAGDRPTTTPDFDAICGGTAPVADSKRVALVVDPGPASIAPTGQTPPAPIVACVVSPSDATGYQVLRSMATVRTDAGLICAVADYPTGECAPVVDDSVVTAAAASSFPASAVAASGNAAMPATGTSGGPSDARGTPWATIAVAVLLLVAAAVAGVRYRRSDRHSHG